jgi:hypothetical protein
MKRFFLFCSGANLEVLRKCPTDESKYAGIGVTILLTAVLASLSGGYALFTVFRSVPMAVVFGALWGVVIFNLDRVIVSGMRKQKHAGRDLAYALPRFAIALLLAVVISRPLELKLFEAEIRNEWMRSQIDARNADIQQIRASERDRVAQLHAENARLNNEVDARRKAYNDAQYASLLENAGKGPSGQAGAGRVFRQYEQIIAENKRQLDAAQALNLPRIRKNEEELKRIEGEQRSFIARTDDVRDESLGFLARMQAFGALKKGDRTIYWAGLFITLLFISLETAPVMVKLLSTFNPYRPYDDLLEQREIEIVEEARQQIRTKRHTLKADADTEIDLATDRNQVRLEAELRAHETLIRRIADAQAELAERLVDRWKEGEMEKIEQGQGAYANNP